MKPSAALSLVACLFAFGVDVLRAGEPLKSAAEARRVAEAFVAEQGYTAAPARRERLVPESFERPAQSIEAVLAMRAKSLEACACGVLAGRWRGELQPPEPSGWSVAFRWRGASAKYPVRVVTLAADGSAPRMLHEMAPASAFRPVRRAP